MDPNKVEKWVDASEYDRLLYRYRSLLQLVKNIQRDIEVEFIPDGVHDTGAANPPASPE
jgi:hypothetical protein